MKQEEKKKRYALIDAARGAALFSMIAYHFCFDFFVLFGNQPEWIEISLVRFWQQTICWTFIFLSGFVWIWGKKHYLQRGILLNFCGLLITVVTLVAVPDGPVWFGVLNFLGCAVLLLMLFEKGLQKIPPHMGILIFFVLFLFFKNVQNGYVGFGSLLSLHMSEELYSFGMLTPFGFPAPGFYSSDYFPILPWLFLYFCGYFACRIFMGKETLIRMALRKVPVLSACGRRTLLVYMLHQPVCMAVCAGIYALQAG